MNLDEISNTTSKQLMMQMSNRIVLWGTMLAIFFGLLTLATPFIANSAAKIYSDSQVRALRESDIRDLRGDLKAVREFDGTLEELKTQVEQISARLDALSQSETNPSGTVEPVR